MLSHRRLGGNLWASKVDEFSAAGVERELPREGTMFAMRSFAWSLSAAAFGLALLGTAAQADDTVTLKMVGAWAHGFSPTADVGKNFMDNVNRLGEGKVKIQYMGADEVIPPFDQPEALVNGVFDVWYGAPNYFTGVVPGGDITELSTHLTPDDGPGSELHDFLVKLYEPKGVRYLGHATGEPGVGTHYVSTQFPVTSIDDLKGKKLRVTPVTRHFVQSAGAESVTLPPGDIFLAMDRRTVDGFTWPVADAFTRYGWQEVTKYMIDQPMYRSGASIAMNLDKWDSLTPETQGILLEAMKETQEWTRAWFAKNLAEQVGLMQKAGMQVLKLSEPEAERWNATAKDSLWAYYKTVLSAEQFETAQRLLAK
ncbi:TRAP transporter substrate-binding protein DctP [Aminobacter ciceronei]|jgi:TRAP-type C4-dicarboxylate transport system substrate-binding protein|uniref:TRAP transporter substrate-binding protein DctP n=1 Tax=Aminobacter ciceronei TaxID=150723 RepID=UPI003F71B63D